MHHKQMVQCCMVGVAIVVHGRSKFRLAYANAMHCIGQGGANVIVKKHDITKI